MLQCFFVTVFAHVWVGEPRLSGRKVISEQVCNIVKGAINSAYVVLFVSV